VINWNVFAATSYVLYTTARKEILICVESWTLLLLNVLYSKAFCYWRTGDYQKTSDAADR